MDFLFFFDVFSTAIDVDAATNIVITASDDGNSGAVGEGDVPDLEFDAAEECSGVAVGVADGLEVDDVGLGVGVGLLVGVGDGLLPLTEL